MRLALVISIVSCLAGSSALAQEGAAPAATAENPLESRIQRLERDLVILQNQGTPTAVPEASSKAAALPQIDELREQIKALRGEIEQLQFELAKNNERMVKFSSDIEFRMTQFEREQQNKGKEQILDKIDEKLDGKAAQAQSESAANSQNNQQAPATDNEIKLAYQEAYQLIRDKKYKEAKVAMEGFIGKYPNSDMTPNAYFWLGEIQFRFQDFDNAAVSYLKGYQANPKGNRAPDNLHKLALTLHKLDKRKEGCVALNKLRKEFPKLTGNIKKQSDEAFVSMRCE